MITRMGLPLPEVGLTQTAFPETPAVARLSGLVAGAVVVAALPCWDRGSAAPVEEERQRYRPTRSYLSPLPTHGDSAFQTETLHTELERLAAPQPLELLSTRRHELPAPASAQNNDIRARQRCENNSMAQLQHQAVRTENLELVSQHGCNAWEVYNKHLVLMIERAQKQLQKLRRNIQDLNWQRKNVQLTAGAKLREMESMWVSLVSKNYEMEQTIVQLENEISQIKQQHGEANKENIQQDFQ